MFVILSRLFIPALWSPAGKGKTSWLSFVMFNCVLSLSHVVSCFRCGARLYRFLIFAAFLTLVLNICPQGEDLDQTDAQSDLNVCFAHTRCIGFAMSWLIVPHRIGGNRKR